MGYSPWGHKESDTTERLPFSLSLDNECMDFNSSPSCGGRGGVSLNLLSGIRWLNQGTQQQQKPCVFPPREGLLSQT